MIKSNYKEFYQSSISHPEIVWDELGKDVIWDTPYQAVLEMQEHSIAKWFVGGKINMSYNCLDVHVKNGHGEETAVIYESTSYGISQRITFNELLKSVELMAGVMVNKCGIVKGDRVLISFPVIPQCLIGMLACTRIGAIHTVVYGGDGPELTAERIKQMKPKLILTCNVGHFARNAKTDYYQKIKEAIKKSSFNPKFCIVYNRPNTVPAPVLPSRDLDWNNEMASALPVSSEPLESDDPMFINYSISLNREFKAFVLATGNSVVSDKYLMKYFKKLKPEQHWWMLSDLGFLYAQTMMTYSSLLNRIPTIFYEGHRNLIDVYNIMNNYKVESFFTSTVCINIFRNNPVVPAFTYEGPKFIKLSGVDFDQNIINWTNETFNCPPYIEWGHVVYDGPETSVCLRFEDANNFENAVAIGINPKIVNDETGEELPRGTNGRLLLKCPLPPTAPITLYNDNNTFIETHFTRYPGFYDTREYRTIMTNENGSIYIG